MVRGKHLVVMKLVAKTGGIGCVEGLDVGGGLEYAFCFPCRYVG